MTKRIACLLAVLISLPVFANELSDAVQADYDDHLAALFDHFHRNPELSTVEHETARRMALELSLAGFRRYRRVSAAPASWRCSRMVRGRWS